jgi:lipopolysaccharide export system permease protein
MRAAVLEALGETEQPGDTGAEPVLEGEVRGPSGAALANLIQADARRLKVQLERHEQRARHLQAGINEYSVEYHKKFAIPFACIVFVMIGAPLAVRFPRGGVGMVIAFSLVIFAIYWSGLTGGETLGDKGLVPPFWGMWAVNIIFVGLGLFALSRFGNETATSRGTALDDLVELVRGLRTRWCARKTGGTLEPAGLEPAEAGRK